MYVNKVLALLCGHSRDDIFESLLGNIEMLKSHG